MPVPRPSLTMLAAAGAAAVLAIGALFAATGDRTDRAAPAPATPAAANGGDPFLRGPYLQRVTETDARLRWIVQGGVPVAITATAADGTRVEARAGTLSGLRPDTAYDWQAAVDGTVRARGRFTTAPAALDRRISFVVFGDYGANTDGERAVGRLAASLEPRMLVTTGDNSYLVAVPDLLDENIFIPMRDAMAGAPNIGVVGDHDVVLPHGQRDLVQALGWPGLGERFDHRYGPIQLVGLGLRADGADVAFARRALARPGPAVRFVVVHQPPKAGNPILPLLRRAGVAAVLAGHLHAYERRSSPEAPGVPLFTVGTGGAPANPGATPRSDDAEVFLIGDGLLAVDVEPGRVRYRFLDTAGRERDRLVQRRP